MATTSTKSSPSTVRYQPKYHNRKDAAYVLPNDTPEHIRLETQARHLSAIMNNQIIHAPILPTTPNLHILDVGCGTGIVSNYLATRFPSAQVFGLDLSPVPQLHDNPTRVRFLQGNVLADRPAEWKNSSGVSPFQSSPAQLDLIFSRLLVCGMSDWEKFVRTELSLLKPGGYVEIQDVNWDWYDNDNNVISDSWPWWKKVRAAGEASGLDWACGRNAAQRLKDAGFVDVQVTTYRWPWGGAGEKDPVYQEFGEYVAKEILELIWHMMARLMEGNVSKEEFREMQEEMKRDVAVEGRYWVYSVTVGRKPE